MLQPGEVLYLPPYVFHRVGGGEELSLSVNVFSESVEHLAAGRMAAIGTRRSHWSQSVRSYGLTQKAQ